MLKGFVTLNGHSVIKAVIFYSYFIFIKKRIIDFELWRNGWNH